MMIPSPAAGRDCGDCTACCIDLLIDDPQLKKDDGVACPNLTAGACGGCGIYEIRPQTCRTWYCGWRLLASLSDAMRPDRSGVMLVPELGQTAGYRRGGLMIVPVAGDASRVVGDELVNFTAKCVAAQVPIYLSYGVGAGARRLLTNPLLEPAAGAGDRADFVRRFTQGLDDLIADAAAPRPRQWGSGPWRIGIGPRAMATESPAPAPGGRA